MPQSGIQCAFVQLLDRNGILTQEKLLSPMELGTLVGLTTAQVRALMNGGRLEFIEISPKTRMLTPADWDRFRREATRVRSPERERFGAVPGMI